MCPLCRVAHRRRYFFQCRSGLLNGSSLLFRPLGEIIGRRADFVCTNINRAGVLRDLAESDLQFFSRIVEILSYGVQSSDKGLLDAIGNIALGQFC